MVVNISKRVQPDSMHGETRSHCPEIAESELGKYVYSEQKLGERSADARD